MHALDNTVAVDVTGPCWSAARAALLQNVGTRVGHMVGGVGDIVRQALHVEGHAFRIFEPWELCSQRYASCVHDAALPSRPMPVDDRSAQPRDGAIVGSAGVAVVIGAIVIFGRCVQASSPYPKRR